MTDYEYTDKELAALNGRLSRIFRRLKLLPFDELNVVNEVVTAYRQADNQAKKAYLDVAVYAYFYAMQEAVDAGYDVEIPAADATPIDADWIQDMLFEADPVTLYEYTPEWERKRQRLIEALAATNKPNQEIDKALKYLVLQISHYMDKATDRAVMQAFNDAGVEYVKRVTAEDERVCAQCSPLDGKIYPIDKAPGILHYRCRCVNIPITV